MESCVESDGGGMMSCSRREWAMTVTHSPSGLFVSTDDRTCVNAECRSLLGGRNPVKKQLIKWLSARLAAWKSGIWPVKYKVVRNYYGQGHPWCGKVEDKKTGKMVSWDDDYPERMLDELSNLKRTSHIANDSI